MSILRIIKKLNSVLDHSRKKGIVWLALLMIIGGILETLSVGLIVPFMDCIVNIDNIMERGYVRIICRIFDLHYPFTVLFVMSTALGLLFILKNIYLVFEYNTQYRFVYNSMFQMQRDVLESFIHRPYEFFLSVNSADVIRLINSDVFAAFGCLTQLLSLFTELVVSTMLILSVLLIMPVVSAVVAVIIAVLLFTINRFIKPRQQRMGVKAQSASSGATKWILQAVNGIKEVKVMNREAFFCEKFSRNERLYIDCQRKSSILSMLPKFVIEATCMSVLFFSVAILVITGSRFEDIIPTLSALAIAAIRLLPSANRMSSTLSMLSYQEPMLDRVIDNLDYVRCEGDFTRCGSDAPLIHSKHIGCLSHDIVMSDIVYRYPNTDAPVLNNASIKINKGEFVGIIGKSGAGKSTALDLLLGLISPEHGSICIDGVDIINDAESWHKQIGYVPQSIFMIDDTIKENVAFGREYDESEILDALNKAALSELINCLPEGINTSIGERGIRLSGGQRQRIGVARAVLGKPQVLVLDEATSSLDEETEKDVMTAIEGLQGLMTIIVITHRTTTIANCDHVYRVDNGIIKQER